MTIKTFWSDPYQTSHDTTVDSVAGDDVTLHSTIFFAFSGGQESDHGSIGGYPVLRAAKAGRTIVYSLPEGHTLAAGQAVAMTIDWSRRYRLMRLHFAAELVLELFYHRIPQILKIGAHIAADKARIDFAHPQSIAALLAEIASAANAIVDADMPISTGFEDVATERRYWEIAGFSRVPCGGTHVRRTGEVGRIGLRRQNIGRGKERVEIRLADAAADTPRQAGAAGKPVIAAD